MSVATIHPSQLAEQLKAGDIDLIDVRTSTEFREAHVEQARNVPLDRLDPSAFKNRSGRLFVICRSGSRGRKACEKLLAAECPDVVNVEGGTLACIEAGLPIIRGRKAVSLERQVRMAAGSLILLGAILGWLAHPLFYWLPALVGGGLIFSGITDTCGMGTILARMPWNRVQGEAPQCCGTKEACS